MIGGHLAGGHSGDAICLSLARVITNSSLFAMSSPGQWRLCNPLTLSLRFGVRRTLDVNFEGSCSLQRMCSSMWFALSINGPLPFAARGEHIDTRVAEPLGDQKGTAVAMLLSGFRLHVAAQASATCLSLRHLCDDLLSTDRGCGSLGPPSMLKRVVTRATARLWRTSRWTTRPATAFPLRRSFHSNFLGPRPLRADVR